MTTNGENVEAAGNGSILETEQVTEKLDVGRCMLWARERCNKGLTNQIAEIFSLSRGHGKLSPEEYYYFGLCDDSRFSTEEKRRFIGRKGTDKLYDKHLSPYFHGIAHDKLLASGVLEGFGIAVPKTLAVFHSFRSYGDVPVFRTGESLAAHLRQDMTYPFFSKPIGGFGSLGTTAVEGLDRESDRLTFGDGREVPMVDYLRELEGFESGAVLQEVLQSHPQIAEATGGRVSTIRLIVLVHDDGPEVYRAIWKVIAGKNMADNFWRSGNLLGAVDPESGRVYRVIRGVGPEQEEIETHPDSGAPVKDIVLPDWPRLIETGKLAASIFPELRIIALDIAICPQGPVVVEVNIGGALNLPQLATGTGMLEPRFVDFLEEVGRPRAIYGC